MDSMKCTVVHELDIFITSKNPHKDAKINCYCKTGDSKILKKE